LAGGCGADPARAGRAGPARGAGAARRAVVCPRGAADGVDVVVRPERLGPAGRQPDLVMRLEGTLYAFSLPDIFQLLSFTKKTGTLHLRRDGGQAHGVVHLRDGAVTGARSDARRQSLGRRIVGAGLVDDKMLAAAVAR